MVVAPLPGPFTCAARKLVGEYVRAFGKNGYRHSVLPSQSPFVPNALTTLGSWSNFVHLVNDAPVSYFIDHDLCQFVNFNGRSPGRTAQIRERGLGETAQPGPCNIC